MEMTERQAVLQLFAPLDGPDAAEAYRQVGTVWQRCATTLDITEPALGLPAGLPPDVPRLVTGPLAAACGPGPGVIQAFAGCEAGVLCLSVANAPKSPASPWADLAVVWDDLLAGVEAGLLGTVRLYVGFYPLGAAESSIEAAAREALPEACHRWPAPTRVAKHRLVWESGAGEDGRAGRTLVVAAPIGTDATLSAWLFTPGAGARAPLTRYLVDAAKVHALARVWRDERRTIDLLARAENGIDRLLDVLGPAATGEELRAAREKVVITQAESAGTVDTLAWVRRAGQTATAAAANLTATRRAHLDGDAPAGPFADDLALAESLRAHLDDDLIHLTITRDRAQQLTDLAGSVLASRLEERQEASRRRMERFGLLQAALIGAVLMGLTAIQSLQYAVPIPNSAKPALVASLGALALYLAAISIWLALPVGAWLADAALALVSGSVLWLAAAWISRQAFDTVLPGRFTALAFGVGVAVAATTAIIRHRRRAA